MTTPEFVVETDPSPEQVQYLEDRVYEYNAGATGIADGESLAIFVRDDAGVRTPVHNATGQCHRYVPYEIRPK